MTPVLTAFQDSVYSWCAKAGLAAKGLDYVYEELDPFDASGQEQLAGRHPFGRVPVLSHDGFTVYETLAILTYIDQAFDGPSLMPQGTKAQARALQVCEMVGAYVYWPCVRQVFSHGAYLPMRGEACEPSEVEVGLTAAKPALAALEDIAQEGLVLDGAALTVAELMLAPMLRYFTAPQQGAAALQAFPALGRLLSWAETRPAFASTRPKMLDKAGECA